MGAADSWHENSKRWILILAAANSAATVAAELTNKLTGDDSDDLNLPRGLLAKCETRLLVLTLIRKCACGVGSAHHCACEDSHLLDRVFRLAFIRFFGWRTTGRRPSCRFTNTGMVVPDYYYYAGVVAQYHSNIPCVRSSYYVATI